MRWHCIIMTKLRFVVNLVWCLIEETKWQKTFDWATKKSELMLVHILFLLWLKCFLRNCNFNQVCCSAFIDQRRLNIYLITFQKNVLNNSKDLIETNAWHTQQMRFKFVTCNDSIRLNLQNQNFFHVCKRFPISLTINHLWAIEIMTI